MMLMKILLHLQSFYDAKLTLTFLGAQVIGEIQVATWLLLRGRRKYSSY